MPVNAAALPATYARFKGDGLIANGGGSKLQIIVAAGTVAYVVLAQHEDGAAATPAIPNATAGALTRLASNMSWPFAETYDAAKGITLQVEFDPVAVRSALEYILSLGDPTTGTPRLRVLRNADGTYSASFYGSSIVSIALTGITPGQKNLVTVALDPATNKLRAWVGEAEIGTGVAATLPASGTVWANQKIGSQGAYANVYRFAVAQGVNTPAAMQGLSVAA